MLVGACSRPEGLVQLQDTFAGPLRALLQVLERRCAEPGLARALAYDCERRILHLSGLTTPTMLSHVMGARVDLRSDLSVTAPPQVDLLYLVVYDGERALGNIDVPLFRSWRARGCADRLALEVAGPRWFVRRTTPLRKARFALQWARFAQGRARRWLRDLPARQRRPALRSEIFDAARVAADRTLNNISAAEPPRQRAETVASERAPRAHTENPGTLPVLMYHRVADDGPAALARYRVSPQQFERQLAFLRAHGYSALTSDAVRAYLAHDLPFPARSVLLTFDDGYADFALHAWPALRRHQLTAEVFIVTDLVGTTAHWDAALGAPAALMSWDQLRALADEGVRFGSHLATHRRADTLSSAELEQELLRSRVALERELRSEVVSIAAPYGFIDSRYLWLAREAGYEVGYSTKHGHARVGDHTLALARMEVRGDMGMAEFERLLMTAPDGAR
jgi:peptidoglycan/xylan/chitin deacetylase (PgdA/CDA1 family)